MPPQRRSKGKKKQPQAGSRKLRLPISSEKEMYGRVVEILGNDHMRIQAANGKMMLGRIRGKIKKRMWIRNGEIVLIVPWDWETAGGDMANEDSQPKCDIIWRYQMTQAKQLFRKRLLPANLAEAMGFTEEDAMEEEPDEEDEKGKRKAAPPSAPPSEPPSAPPSAPPSEPPSEPPSNVEEQT